MFPVARNGPPSSLYDLALHTLIQANPLGGQISNFEYPEVRSTLARWQNLKEYAPLGPLDIAAIMRTIEKEFHVSKQFNLAQVEGISTLVYQEKFPNTFRINLLFHELHRKLDTKLKEYEATLGQQIPIGLDQLESVQQTIHFGEENRTLERIWQGLIATRQITLNGWEPRTIQEMYYWFYHPANAEQIEQIQDLNLSGGGIKVLPSLIDRFRGLRRLNLSNNLLRYLPESLSNLPHLTELYLQNNYVLKLPGSLGNLTSLRTLNLNYNDVTELPESFVNLRELRSFSCSSNRLSQLPKDFGNLTNLRILKLNDNRLVKLPESFGNLAALVKLHLQLNYLVTLPKSFDNLKALRQLSLASNHFAVFPEQLCELTSLIMLNFSDNAITALSDRISQLIALKELNLAYNRLKEIPESCGQLASLKILYLFDNELHRLPLSLCNLTLRFINLENNPLLLLTEADRLWPPATRKRKLGN